MEQTTGTQAAQAAPRKAPGRNLNLDLIRAISALFVLCSHFLLNAEFYDSPVNGKRMYLMVVMRYIFVTCVPMFLMLTGYLSGNKKPAWSYFKKLGHTLLLYLLASIVCLLFKNLYLHAGYGLWDCIKLICNYTASSYAWYVEMYIGLFLLCPFLNVMYKGLESQRQKLLLVGVLIALTCGASLFNIYDDTAKTILWPSDSPSYAQIVPAWWTFLYPVQFYMIGMYLREYGWSISIKRNLLYILIATAFFATYNYVRSYHVYFSFFSPWIGRSSLENMVISVLVFNLLLHLPLGKTPKWLAVAIRKVSELSFLIYLLSAPSDNFIYPILNRRVPDMLTRLNYFPLVIASSFLLAMAAAQVVMWVYKLLMRLIGRIPKRKTHAA